MNLSEALSKFSEVHLDTHNNWYNWRKINHSKLPKCIILNEDDNQYHQNISLKEQLSKKYAVADSRDKITFTRYYISTWGGIHTNRDETIKCYALSSSEHLISLGTKGIASWSKALCMRDHEKYPIYDARVAFSLNLLQIAFKVKDPVLYPLLPSRNSSAKKWKSLICSYLLKANWRKATPSGFYEDYINLLKVSSKELGCCITSLEMLLFSQPQNLFERACSSK